MRQLIWILTASVFCFVCLNARADSTLNLQVNDKATSEAIPGADISVQVDNGGAQKFKTDDQGRVSFNIKDPGKRLSITASIKGYVTVNVGWNVADKAQHPIPESYTLELEPGSTIGGIVKDEKGAPVAGATVHLMGENRPGESGVVVPRVNGNAKTDDQGKWTVNTMPANLPKQMWYNIDGPNLYNDNVYKQMPDMKELKLRTAVITVHHAIAIKGKVVDPDGKPVAGAQVAAGDEGWWGARHKAKTTTDGTFTMKGMKPGVTALTVLAKGYAAQMTSANAGSDEPIEIKLKPGNKLSIHVIDSAGKPIQGVEASVEEWHGNSTLEFKMRTDAEGNAVWDSAPDDAVSFNFNKRGLGQIDRKPLTATTQPITITMRPPAKINGTVVDAATGQSIPAFKVTKGISWGENDQINWMDERYGQEQRPIDGKDGKFSYTMAGQTYPRHLVRVSAGGYLPVDSKFFKPEDGDQNFEFKLEKGTPIAGVISTADHKPAANLQVYMAMPGRQMQIDNGAIAEWVAQQSPHTLTDDSGHYTFPPQKDAVAIVALSNDGYGRLDVGKLGTTRPSTFDVTLDAWSKVEGTLMIGSKPGAGEQISIQSNTEGWSNDRPYVYISYGTTTDSAGHFKFDHVVPGKISVGRTIHFNERSSTVTHMVPTTAPAGGSVSVTIGGTGRPVTGKLEVPTDVAKKGWMSWDTRISTHRKQLKPPPVPKTLKGQEEIPFQHIGILSLEFHVDKLSRPLL